MLSRLYIENMAVIEKTEIEFRPGMNVLTGETGAGKSILIDCIGAILGGRISREMIRTGTNSAFVSAVFSRVTPAAIEKLEELGYSLDDDDNLLIQREVSLEGRALCRINGRPATVTALKELGGLLINIHGQHESYQLLSPDLHMRYIDRMSGLEGLLSQYRTAYNEMRKLHKEIEALSMDEAQKSRRIDLLNYQIEELENAGLQPGEQEQLTQQRALYQNSEKIALSLSGAKEAIDGDEIDGGALSALGVAAGYLAQVQNCNPGLQSLLERIQAIQYDLKDCREEICSFSSQLEYDPNDLEQIEQRLDVLYRLGLKYGETEEEMLEFLEQCRQELKSIQFAEDKIAAFSQQYEENKKRSIDLARELSKKRTQTIIAFTEAVKKELTFLDMPGVTFQVEQERCPLNATGCDKIQFLISTNPGETVKPIAKIASGGELSRIMLAIKTVLSDKDEIDTLIFDEIDTGISGGAAQKVGLKLKQVAKNRQVICVTHLAQIAAQAGHHLLIKKHLEENRTYTQVSSLDYDGRKKELARIMGGSEITALMLENATEMLKRAGNFSEN